MLSGPPINSSVTLDAAGWDEPRRTRVEDLDDEVVVAAPLHGTADQEPLLGASLILRWLGRSGPMTVPVTLVAKDRRQVSMWRLKPEGNVLIDQRRHHFRASTLMPIVFHSEGEAIGGHLLDLSEGGVRFASSPARELQIGATGEIRFCVLEEEFRLGVGVVRARDEAERVLVACRFTAVQGADQDRVRRAVFALQVRMRRQR